MNQCKVQEPITNPYEIQNLAQIEPNKPKEENLCEVIWSSLELKTSKNKQILFDSTGILRPRTITAILGPSGSGKTSLLNALSGRIPSGWTLQGSIKLNGKDRNPAIWPHITAYVPQEFHCYEWQTVRETFKFVQEAKGDLPGQVDALIDLLGLKAVRDTPIIHLSGGERVRVGLGVELMGNPSILLLDEPLSGLDSSTALTVLSLLRRIANMGKTVLVTVHQPSQRMISWFDAVILMCQGRTVYGGSVANCVEFFESCGCEIPEGVTVTDYFLEILTADADIDSDNKENSENINYKNTRMNNKNGGKVIKSTVSLSTILSESALLRAPPLPTINTSVTPPSVIPESSQFIHLFKRSISNCIRNSSLIRVRLFQKAFVAFVFGSTFFRAGVRGANIFTFRGILLFICQSELFGVSGPLMNLFIDEKKAIHRERSGGLYSGHSIFFAKFLAELTFNALYSLPHCILIYLLVGFDASISKILQFAVIIFFIISYAVAWGLTISTVSSSTQAAHALSTAFTVTFFLYSGAFSDPSSHPSGLRWLFWISPVHYSFRALVHNQLGGLINSKPSGDGVVNHMVVRGEETLKDFGLDGFGVWPSLLVLFLFTGSIAATGAAVLHMKTASSLKVGKTLKNINSMI